MQKSSTLSWWFPKVIRRIAPHCTGIGSIVNFFEVVLLVAKDWGLETRTMKHWPSFTPPRIRRHMLLQNPITLLIFFPNWRAQMKGWMQYWHREGEFGDWKCQKSCLCQFLAERKTNLAPQELDWRITISLRLNLLHTMARLQDNNPTGMLEIRFEFREGRIDLFFTFKMSWPQWLDVICPMKYRIHGH